MQIILTITAVAYGFGLSIVLAFGFGLFTFSHKHPVSTGNSTAEDNTATLTQSGDDNAANIFQGSGSVFVRTSPDDPTLISASPSATTALRSEATISQHGDDHYAVTIQAGTDDMISIQQSGNGSFARVAQGTAIP